MIFFNKSTIHQGNLGKILNIVCTNQHIRKNDKFNDLLRNDRITEGCSKSVTPTPPKSVIRVKKHSLGLTENLFGISPGLSFTSSTILLFPTYINSVIEGYERSMFILCDSSEVFGTHMKRLVN